MGFMEPARLWWLVAAGVYASGLWWMRRRDAALKSLVVEEALQPNLVDPAIRRRAWKDALLVAAFVLAVIASARPQWGSKMAEVKRRGNDIFICVDTSSSMSAEDVSPTRMVAAKRTLGLVVSQLQGDRVGIIAFAGRAFLQCPLTLDVDAARMFLDAVDVGLVPVPGTEVGTAVRAALSRFPKNSRTKKVIVLLTDGEDHESDPIGAAEEAKKAGAVIFAVGIGTPQGEVLRERDSAGGVTGFKKDDKGETVMSRLDEATLSRMAEITGGKYWRGGTDDSVVTALVTDVSSMARQALSSGMYRVQEDRYQWFLLLAVLALGAEFLVSLRKGHWPMVWREFQAIKWDLPKLGRKTAAVAGFVAVLLPSAVRADFRSSMNGGNKAALAGDLEGARQKYFNAQVEGPGMAEPHYNIGNTWLYEGKYEDALRSYDEADRLARNPQLKAAIAYNRGWALARLEKTPEAIEAFKSALKWNPGDADAKYNLEFLKSGRKPRQDKGGKGQGKPGDGKQQKMSKEDAERLLEMVKGQEQALRDAKKKQKKDEKKASGGKDW
jgi:Ca-activated chloride channel family protein